MDLDTSATTKPTMAQEGDAEITTSFSKLNVNAMEFVPSFAATASQSTTAAAAGATTTTITNSHQEEQQQQQQQQQEINNEIEQQQAAAAATPPPQPTQPPLSLPLDKIEDLATPNNGKLCE